MTATSMQRSSTSKPLMLAGFAVGCCIVSLVSSAMQPSFVSGSLGERRAVSTGRADGANGEDIPRWQRGLDKFIFNHEASPIDRVNGINTYWKEGGLQGAAQKLFMALHMIQEKGPDGAQEALDYLIPRGLQARADLDAWLYVMEKAGPQRLLTELEELRVELARQGVKPPREIANFAESISERFLPVGADQASLSASYIFRRLPQAKGENVDYIVIYNHKDFEVRVYQPFHVAKASIEGRLESVTGVFASSVRGDKTSVSEAFTAIVDYVDKQQGEAKVLMPIMTHYSKNEITPTGMSMPLEVPGEAKLHSDARVSYSKAQMQIVAVRKFLGVATDREIRDQYEILKNAVTADGVYDAKDGSYSLMQYNPPLTMPWRRSNEIAIHIKAPKQNVNFDRAIKPLHKFDA